MKVAEVRSTVFCRLKSVGRSMGCGSMVLTAGGLVA